MSIVNLRYVCFNRYVQIAAQHVVFLAWSLRDRAKCRDIAHDERQGVLGVESQKDGGWTGRTDKNAIFDGTTRSPVWQSALLPGLCIS